MLVTKNVRLECKRQYTTCVCASRYSVCVVRASYWDTVLSVKVVEYTENQPNRYHVRNPVIRQQEQSNRLVCYSGPGMMMIVGVDGGIRCAEENWSRNDAAHCNMCVNGFYQWAS